MWIEYKGKRQDFTVRNNGVIKVRATEEIVGKVEKEGKGWRATGGGVNAYGPTREDAIREFMNRLNRQLRIEQEEATHNAQSK